MKLSLLTTGKTTQPEVKSLCADYTNRINRYIKYEETVLDNSAIRLTDPEKIKQKEGELLLKKISPTDYLVLLDEAGKEHTSVEFAGWLQGVLNKGHKWVWFVVGGAYGFSPAVYQRANARLSLSKMTCNHQLIRAVFAEQLYRAFTIINNEPYHHQ